MTQPAAARLTPYNIRDEIRAMIAKGAVDPYKIAKRLAGEIPPELTREYVEGHILNIVRTIMSDGRNTSFVEVTVDREKGKTIEAFAVNKWTASRVYVPGVGYVKYNDLTAKDCAAIVSHREAEITGLQAEQTRFKRLGAAITRAGVKTAGELPEATRMEIFR